MEATGEKTNDVTPFQSCEKRMNSGRLLQVSSKLIRAEEVL